VGVTTGASLTAVTVMVNVPVAAVPGAL